MTARDEKWNINISFKNFIFLENFDSEFLYIELWFTDQNFKTIEIKDKVKVT